MVKVSETFSGGQFLKKEDLQGKRVRVTIESVSLVEFDEGNKLVLKFTGKDKQLVANKTNSTLISQLHGDDTDDWIGQEIQIYNDPTVTMSGQVVGGIRVWIDPADITESEDEIPF
jgi:hypothetical protein